jgi:hypothetical protein
MHTYHNAAPKPIQYQYAAMNRPGRTLDEEISSRTNSSTEGLEAGDLQYHDSLGSLRYTEYYARVQFGLSLSDL